MLQDLGPYLGMVFAIALASIGVPIPEDIALLGGGLACYIGSARIQFMIPLAMVSILSGDLFIYLLGRRWGSHILEHRFARRLATEEQIEAIAGQFRRHQFKTIFVARFLPGLRALVFLTAGTVKLSPWRFLAANGSAAMLSVPALIVLGYVFGRSFEVVTEHVREVKHTLVVLAVAAAAIYILWLSYARSAKAREAKRLLADREKKRAARARVEISPPETPAETWTPR